MALVVSLIYLESEFMGYISAKDFGFTSPSKGRGKVLGSSPESNDPGTDPRVSELKSSINPCTGPIGGPDPVGLICSLENGPVDVATGGAPKPP